MGLIVRVAFKFRGHGKLVTSRGNKGVSGSINLLSMDGGFYRTALTLKEVDGSGLQCQHISDGETLALR